MLSGDSGPGSDSDRMPAHARAGERETDQTLKKHYQRSDVEDSREQPDLAVCAAEGCAPLVEVLDGNVKDVVKVADADIVKVGDAGMLSRDSGPDSEAVPGEAVQVPWHPSSSFPFGAWVPLFDKLHIIRLELGLDESLLRFHTRATVLNFLSYVESLLGGRTALTGSYADLRSPSAHKERADVLLELLQPLSPNVLAEAATGFY